jgi:hypothetical protein
MAKRIAAFSKSAMRSIQPSENIRRAAGDRTKLTLSAEWRYSSIQRDFAAARDEAALSELPKPERKERRAFWPEAPRFSIARKTMGISPTSPICATAQPRAARRRRRLQSSKKLRLRGSKPRSQKASRSQSRVIGRRFIRVGECKGPIRSSRKHEFFYIPG